ncbi:MAG: copper amine oxidase N-terminal domain-containing protein [Defluviitaleaceae bacterium]|nr:copper amine oxidase N-terminal domain-containing protein [Defluviitaleaceae bacterium]
MKKLLAVLTITVLTLGSAVTAFANTNPAPVALQHTTGTYVSASGAILGTYPRITANASTTAQIRRAMDRVRAENPTLDFGFSNPSRTTFTFDIQEHDTVSRIVINFTDSGNRTNPILTLFVNNATGATITESAFEEAIAPPADVEDEIEENYEEIETIDEEIEEVEEEVEEQELPQIAEPTVLALRANAEALGFEVIWNPEGYVDVVSEEMEVRVMINSNIVIIDGEEIELPSYSVVIENTLFVNIDFFTEILGAYVVECEDGNLTATWDAPEAMEVIEEVEETDEEETEE